MQINAECVVMPVHCHRNTIRHSVNSAIVNFVRAFGHISYYGNPRKQIIVAILRVRQRERAPHRPFPAPPSSSRNSSAKFPARA